MARYILGDTHCGHRNIANFRKRNNPDGTPMSSEEQHEVMFEALCQVNKRDTLWLTGDIAFTKEWLYRIKDIPCKNKIAVVGNHSVSLDTEVLTSEGWKLSPLITEEDSIATKNLLTGEIEYHYPHKVSTSENQPMYTVQGHWADEWVSEGHHAIYQNKRTPVSTLEGIHHNKQFSYCGTLRDEGTLEVDWVKLLTWVVCDGTIVQGDSKNKKRIQFKLSKQRKIDGLRKLLEDMDIPYTFKLCKKTGINKLQPYYIRIYGDWGRDIWSRLNGAKKFPESFRTLSGEKFQAFWDTLAITDGNLAGRSMKLVTTSKEDSDVIQIACLHNNSLCRIKEEYNKSGFANGKLQYIMTLYPSGYVPMGKVIVSKANSSDVVSISVRNETLITRRNGKVSITGNCCQGKIKMQDHCNVFDKVYSVTTYKKYWIQHTPIHKQELRGRRMIHAHTHYHLMLELFSELPDRDYITTSAEYTDFKPIQWEYLISDEYYQECVKKWRQYNKLGYLG